VYYADVHAVARCTAVANGCTNGKTTYTTSGTFTGIDQDGTNVYFSENAGTSADGVYQCAIGTTCASPKHLATDAETARTRTDDGAHLYWYGVLNDGPHMCTLPNCTGASHQTDYGVTDISVDSTNLYWSDGAKLRFQALAGGSPNDVTSGESQVFRVRSDGTYLYWLTGGGTSQSGQLHRAKLPNGNVETLASNLNQAAGLVVTPNAVYFTTRGDSTIWVVTK